MSSQAHINVALLGLGNVGRSFARYIEKTSDDHPFKINILAVADRSGGLLLDDAKQIGALLDHKAQGGNVSMFAPPRVADPRSFIAALPEAGIDILIESLPTDLSDGQPALDLIAAALAQGTSVVTVDKGPLVHGFERLVDAARSSAAQIAYSGTTGVVAPDEISGHRVLEIRGVLNGTTNYILTQMQQGKLSFGEALERAQADGIAEPDPSLDVEGWDTASKLLILAKSLMGADAAIGDVARIGIGPETESLIQVAQAKGRVIRLLGRARFWQGRARLSVAPKMVERGSPFYDVAGTSKAAVFRTEQGEALSHGLSGRDAISRTILNDIAGIARRLRG